LSGIDEGFKRVLKDFPVVPSVKMLQLHYEINEPVLSKYKKIGPAYTIQLRDQTK
jgi:hypothetical protein